MQEIIKNGENFFEMEWLSKQYNVRKSFQSLRNLEDFSDVTLVGDDFRQIAAHKIILSSCSSYFHNIKSEASNFMLGRDVLSRYWESYGLYLQWRAENIPGWYWQIFECRSKTWTWRTHWTEIVKSPLPWIPLKFPLFIELKDLIETRVWN